MSTHARTPPALRIRTVLAALAIVATLAGCGGAGATASGSVTTSGAWVRPGAAGGDTAAYLVIANAAGTADTLVSASSADADSVGLHQTMTDASGMTGMQPMTGIDIPAGGSVTLEPGGTHLMVMGLAKDLTAGGMLDVELHFKNAGTVTVRAQVKQN
jgi:periplasmic copper chaperone A